MSKEKNKSRRKFLQKLAGTSALLAGAPTIVSASNESQSFEIALKKYESFKYAPNDQINIGLIGAGGMGMGDLDTALKCEGTKIVAAADVYDGRLVRMKEKYGKDVFTTRDYREILNRKDIDAVIIATPDHLHASMATEAMKAGKAVYLEKPMVQKIDEGYGLIKTAQETGKVIQIGSQFVSSILFEKAKELYESGAIGELNYVEVCMDRFSAQGAWQYTIPPDASEKNIDWDRFLSHAPKRAFEPIRLFRWRNYQDYGTAIAGDLFVHLFSQLHTVTSSTGPERILSTGGLRYWKDGRDVPDVQLAIFDYPKTDKHPAFNVSFRVNFIDGSGGNFINRLVGSEGEIRVGWDSLTVKKSKMPKDPGHNIGTFAQATQEEYMKLHAEKYGWKPELRGVTESNFKVPQGYNDRLDHFMNWVMAIRGKGKIVEDAVFGMRAAAPALASNISYYEKQIVKWNPNEMKVIA